MVSIDSSWNRGGARTKGSDRTWIKTSPRKEHLSPPPVKPTCHPIHKTEVDGGYHPHRWTAPFHKPPKPQISEILPKCTQVHFMAEQNLNCYGAIRCFFIPLCVNILNFCCRNNVLDDRVLPQLLLDVLYTTWCIPHTTSKTLNSETHQS